MTTLQVDEAKRLAALYETEILDSLPEQAFDDITVLAAQICGTPIARVSFVDSDRQWIKASTELEAEESPRSSSFCAHTISTGQTLLVEDSWADERFRDNPLVTGSPYVRSYAGAPIIDNDQVLGTVCVVDTAPRTLSADQISGLSVLARQVVGLLRQRKILLAEQRAARAALSHSEESLQVTAERLKLSQAAGKIASWEWDYATNVLTWAGGTEWVYGRPASELSNAESAFSFIYQDDLPRVRQALAHAVDGVGGFSTEYRVVWPDGSVHWSQSIGQPVLSPRGQTTRIVGVQMDITARKAAEEGLLQSEKVAAVGRLASTIAHEINNPLASITNLLFLARQSGSLAEADEFLSIAEEELQRVTEITNQSLRFYRNAANPTEVLAESVVSAVLRLQRARIVNTGITVETRHRACKPIRCFEGEIRQVVASLVSNAIDAMAATKGRLLIRSREAVDWRTGRPGIVITVADTGPGISKEVVADIFTPFFTTKIANGTGLGLWVAKEIVERHQGTLKMCSRETPPRSGSVFAVFLPS